MRCDSVIITLTNITVQLNSIITDWIQTILNRFRNRRTLRKTLSSTSLYETRLSRGLCDFCFCCMLMGVFSAVREHHGNGLETVLLETRAHRWSLILVFDRKLQQLQLHPYLKRTNGSELISYWFVSPVFEEQINLNVDLISHCYLVSVFFFQYVGKL